MPSYTVVARNQEMSPIVSVSITAIDQETHLIDEIDVVNAVRARLAAMPETRSVIAQKYEQVITVV